MWLSRPMGVRPVRRIMVSGSQRSSPLGSESEVHRRPAERVIRATAVVLSGELPTAIQKLGVHETPLSMPTPPGKVDLACQL